MQTTRNAQENPAAGMTPPIIPSMPWRVLTAEPLPDYRIRVRFLDGLEGVVDMAGLVRSSKAGVFADLADEARFQALSVELGVVTWPDGQDLAPDAMHAAIKQYGQWVLT